MKALGVIGEQVHDARLVAICHVHGVTHLLTFNRSHFTRFSGSDPGILVVDPASVGRSFSRAVVAPGRRASPQLVVQALS